MPGHAGVIAGKQTSTSPIWRQRHITPRHCHIMPCYRHVDLVAWYGVTMMWPSSRVTTSPLSAIIRHSCRFNQILTPGLFVLSSGDCAITTGPCACRSTTGYSCSRYARPEALARGGSYANAPAASSGECRNASTASTSMRSRSPIAALILPIVSEWPSVFGMRRRI